MQLDARTPGYLNDFFAKFPDDQVLYTVAQFFLNFSHPDMDLEAFCGQMLREALDEVIDMPRTGRFSLSQLEKTEKTYIGTKVEIVFRDGFKLSKGDKLDLLVEGVEVDVKNTIGSNWTIPSEAVDEVCVLLRSDDNRSCFDFGLILCRESVFNLGKNRDSKRTLSQLGRQKILWLVRNGQLPRNIFLHMDEDVRTAVLSPKGGSERLANLFRFFPHEAISRNLVECVAQQKDYMKRLRGNGGARDILAQEGMLILWGGKVEDREQLLKMGFNNVGREVFYCIKQPV